MIMKQFITVILLTLFYNVSFAQTVELYFPYFAGNEYTFYLSKGTSNDTVQTGTIGATGRLNFTLPEKDKDYVGIVHFTFGENSNLNFILNKENFSISNKDANPSESNIVFTNSAENDFLRLQLRQQQVLFRKIDVVYRGQDAYADDPILYPVFEKEFAYLQGLYDTRQKTLTASNLYAAQYIRIIGFLNGFGSRLYAPSANAERLQDAIRFINDELDMDILYSSGFWNHLISSTFELFANKTAFGEAMVNNLKRIRSQQVFEVLANDLITICEQYGWIDAENVIIPYLLSSGKITNPQGKLYMAFELDKVKAGSKAQPIEGQKNLSNVLLMFYESGCSNCVAQLDELKKHYAELQKKKIRVIVISADTGKEVFEYHSKDFPWPDKLCDFNGFDGKNFRNYGVVGTPTFYLIDKKEIITGRYARLKDTGLLD
jgi:peroxiredoxin